MKKWYVITMMMSIEQPHQEDRAEQTGYGIGHQPAIDFLEREDYFSRTPKNAF